MSNHQFYGKHLIASYKGCCSKVINDPEKIKKIMTLAIQISGATILNDSDFTFTTDDPSVVGYTAVFLLSESHASIHTYPEYGCAFVDLFTCGTTCTWEEFHAAMIKGLRSESQDFKIIQRS